MTCLAKAFPAVVEYGMLHALAAHPCTTVTADDPERWEALGGMHALVESISAAGAALPAVDADCRVLTARPDPYENVAGGTLVITLANCRLRTW